MGDFIKRVQSRLFDSKYSLSYKLGEGGCGTVWLGRNTRTGAEVALKLAYARDELSLDTEYSTYQKLDGLVGFAEAMWLGDVDEHRCLVLDLLGPNLSDLLHFCGGRFSLKTTLMVADQLLSRYEALHSQRRIVHRDVKPENCMFGSGKDGNVIYVSDFGLAREFVPVERCAAPVDEPPRRHAVGTPPWSSIRGHSSDKVWPSDDLESLGYALVYLMRGELPWQLRGEQDLDEAAHQRFILEKKRAMTSEELCQGLPSAFAEYMSTVRCRVDEQAAAPDHAALRKIFRDLAHHEGIEYDNVFDWTTQLYLLAHRKAPDG